MDASEEAGVVVLVALAVTVLVMIVVLPAWVMEAPAASPSKMDALRAGMTKAEVKELLGSGHSTHPMADGSESWVYTRFTWAILYVDFDASGRLVKYRQKR
jgi:outer membrane protein assembly factor BamE (lipoprotein component of BamABCDE complex)